MDSNNNNTVTDNEPDTDNELTEAFSVSEEYNNRTSLFLRRRHSEHYRRHEFLADRLEAYSDAVFAIVGTILIAYLRQVIPTFHDPNINLRKELIDNIPLFTVYHYTFFHVSIIWLNHSRIFIIIERVNDVLIWLNMLLLYAVSFVPLTFGVLGEFKNTYEGILIPSITLVVVNVILTIIMWYGFRRERFLHSELPEDHYTLIKKIMYCNVIPGPLFALLAVGLGHIDIIVAQVCFYLSTVMLIVPRIIVYIVWSVCKKETDSQLSQPLFHISKERIEFFTDGIYSIVSTLVILDITIDGIPSRELVNSEYDGSLVNALCDRHLQYITYFTTFLVISLLWFIHHSLFNFVRKLNPLMLIIHLFSCSLIGTVPPIIEMLLIYFDAESGENEATAIQLAAGVISIIGILQLVLLSLMYFADSECINPTLFHTRSSLHLFLKVMIVPVTGMIAYWCTLGSPQFRAYSFYVLYLCSPLTFVVINIIMKSEMLHSLFFHCWEVQNRWKESLWERIVRSNKIEIEMENCGGQERPDKVEPERKDSCGHTTKSRRCVTFNLS